MKIAILESIDTPGGHEVDFDRILAEELTALGHEVCFYVPERFVFKFDYKLPVRYLPGDVVSYEGLRGWRKALASARKEFNRQRWFRAAAKLAREGAFDLLIIPTATHRYLRALRINDLKHSPVPVVFIMHGINPKEAPHFFREVENLSPYPQIHSVVLTFGDSLFGRRYPQLHCINPPVYSARDMDFQPAVKKTGTLALGFFGQYRKEKNLGAFLDAFLACRFTQPVKLIVQGATVHPSDAEDFERLQEKYRFAEHITFWHQGLFGRAWQEAIAGIDALIMPYSASRYLYHWSGMLFTAIGYHKPVVVSSDINPEVLAQYQIGLAFESSRAGALQTALEEFVNTYVAQASLYETELDRANREYSPRLFCQRLVGLLREGGR